MSTLIKSIFILSLLFLSCGGNAPKPKVLLKGTGKWKINAIRYNLQLWDGAQFNHFDTLLLNCGSIQFSKTNPAETNTNIEIHQPFEKLIYSTPRSLSFSDTILSGFTETDDAIGDDFDFFFRERQKVIVLKNEADSMLFALEYKTYGVNNLYYYWISRE